ncbi:MAG: hypothetical protein OXD49_04790 [Candidatus Poribacteria bacterium]|nr:hypothetical protein [Candidatus Poribacteria bacterium]
MDEGTRDWLTKIEAQLNGLNNMTIEKLSSITTKLDIYLPKQTDQENRINKLEDIDIMFLDAREKNAENNAKKAISRQFKRSRNGIAADLKPKRVEKHLQSRHLKKIP